MESKNDDKHIGTLPQLLRDAASYIEADDSISITWTDVLKLLNFIFLSGNVLVTDDVYTNIYGIKWDALRYHYGINDMKKKQISVTPFKEVSEFLPKKYKNKVA